MPKIDPGAWLGGIKQNAHYLMLLGLGRMSAWSKKKSKREI